VPIYEQAYRKYEARAALRKARFWPITREALRLILGKRAFLGLLVLGWLPFLGFVIYVWALTQFGQAAEGMATALPRGGAVFAQFFKWQMLLGLLLTTFGGAGLVANDLRTGAILVYLSRPLTRRDYVIGKLAVLLAINLFVTLVPGLLLYGVAVALAPAQFLTWDLAWLGPAVALHAVVLSLALSLPALAVSSLSRSARVAGLTFFGLLMGLDMVSGIVGAIARWPATILFSIQACVNALGDALLGAPREAALPWAYPALVLAAVAFLSLAVLRSRVRAVEIVR
jgi:ABC-type transport system involved in multi-copper enzyme maturation permease subunit